MKRNTALSILIVLLVFQIITHTTLLSIWGHSGQIAIPWMMNQGKVLFEDLLEQHAPGSSLVAALGQRILPLDPLESAKALNLASVLTITVIVFALAWRLSGGQYSAAIAAALVWVWWEPVYGNVLLYFDSLMGLALIIAVLIWVFTQNLSRGWIAPFFTGLALGGATLFKQHAWAAIVIVVLWLIVFGPRPKRGARIAWFAAGAMIVPALIVIVVALQGNLSEYIYWNWTYNLEGLMPGVTPTSDFIRKILITGFFVPLFWLGSLRSPHRADWIMLGLVWLAGNATLYPRQGDFHFMAQLPALSVLSGLAIALILDDWLVTLKDATMRTLPANALILPGLLVTVVVLWGMTGLTMYEFRSFGHVQTRSYDEFRPLADRLRVISDPDDTLFILPETDNTPQLHVLSKMLPPGTWIKSYYWYLTPEIVDQLLTEWDTDAPDVVVIFTNKIGSNVPAITPLVDFVMDYYTQVDEVFVKQHGPAQIYTFNAVE